MIIRFVQFKEDVETPVHQEYDPKKLELEFVDLKYLKQLVLDGTVEKGHDALVFRGRMVSDVEHICGRCLKGVPEHVDQSFELFYETKNKDHIDATDDLREVLILNHPISFLCSKNCKLPGPVSGRKRDVAANQDLTYKAFMPLKQMWERKKEDKKHGTT